MGRANLASKRGVSVIDRILELLPSEPEQVGVLILLSVPLLFVLRRIYIRRYLKHRLFFEPWLNLSDDKTLNIGASLSELLYFELESLRELLARAQADGGLWNERSGLPLLERLFEGYPDFIRQIEMLDLPGRIGKLFRAIFATKPNKIYGTIHRFGDTVRLQVMLDGPFALNRQDGTNGVDSSSNPSDSKRKRSAARHAPFSRILLGQNPTKWGVPT